MENFIHVAEIFLFLMFGSMAMIFIASAGVIVVRFFIHFLPKIDAVIKNKIDQNSVLGDEMKVTICPKCQQLFYFRHGNPILCPECAEERNENLLKALMQLTTAQKNAQDKDVKHNPRL